MDLAVEAARTQQRRVKHVWPIGCGNYNNSIVGLEPVHFHQELVQSLLPFIIASAIADAAASAHGINFVDEDDARSVFLSLLEHIAHTARPDTHEHFNEVGAGDREERHARFAGNRARQQRLAGSRRADEQRALGNFAAKARELLRVAQKLDDFLQFLLCLVNSGNIVECHSPLLLAQKLCAGLSKAHRASAAAALHPVHEIYPDPDQNNERQEGYQQCGQA